MWLPTSDYEGRELYVCLYASRLSWDLGILLKAPYDTFTRCSASGTSTCSVAIEVVWMSGLRRINTTALPCWININMLATNGHCTRSFREGLDGSPSSRARPDVITVFTISSVTDVTWQPNFCGDSWEQKDPPGRCNLQHHPGHPLPPPSPQLRIHSFIL